MNNNLLRPGDMTSILSTGNNLQTHLSISLSGKIILICQPAIPRNDMPGNHFTIGTHSYLFQSHRISLTYKRHRLQNINFRNLSERNVYRITGRLVRTNTGGIYFCNNTKVIPAYIGSRQSINDTFSFKKATGIVISMPASGHNT